MCSGLRTRIACPNYEVVSVVQPGFQPRTVDKSALDLGCPTQCDVVLRLKKILYGQSEAARRWYQKFQNGLLDRSFVVIKVDAYLFMYKTVIFVVYVDYFLFWERSKSDIDNVMRYFKYDGPSYNLEHSRDIQCLSS